MTTTRSFTVIIPVHGKWDLTRDCLKSLAQYTRDYIYDVIVVDNASTDATKTELVPLGETLFGRDRFSRIRFEENRNFGPACNEGARSATGDLLFFLNNDTLATPDWAGPLLESVTGLSEIATGAGVKTLDAAGPLLLYEDDTVQHLGVVSTVFTLEHLYRGLPATNALTSKRRKLRIITGAALILPANLYRENAGFYEGYVNGFEDVDLCLRLFASGKTVGVVPESRLYHLESRTAGRKDADAANRSLLEERCGKLFRPDKHVVGMRDGLEPYINDMWDISLHLSGAQERELEKAYLSSGLSLQEHSDLLREQPLWHSGRASYRDRLWEEGNVVGACLEQAELAHLTMRRADYERLAAMINMVMAGMRARPDARTAGEGSSDIRGGVTMEAGAAAEQATAPLIALEQKAGDMAERMDRRGTPVFVRSLLRRISEWRDPLLEKLFDDKLKRTPSMSRT